MSAIQTVFLTGANGFIALHTVGLLLDKGLKVIGSVRSQEKADKVKRQFTEKFGKEFVAERLELVVIPDITDKASFDKLFKEHTEIVHVLHTAAPYVYGLDNYDENYLKPALGSAKAILHSIKEFAPQVKKVVYTSSGAAMMDVTRLFQDDYEQNEKAWNPMEWTPETITNDKMAYLVCKKVSERAAWEASKEEGVNYKLIVVNPVFVFGPTYFDEDAAAPKINESCQIMKDMVLKSDPSDTHVFDEHNFLVIDVRDIAKMHVFPLSSDKADGKRLFGAVDTFNDQKLLNIINEKFPSLNGKIAKGSPEMAEKLPKQKWDNTETRKILGDDFEWIGLEQQVVETVQQILDAEEKYNKK